MSAEEVSIRKQIAEADAKDRQSMMDLMGEINNAVGNMTFGDKSKKKDSGKVVEGLKSAFGAKTEPSGKAQSKAASQSSAPKSGEKSSGGASSKK